MTLSTVLILLVILSCHEAVKGHFVNTISAKYKKDLIEIIKALNGEKIEKIKDKTKTIINKENSDELTDGEKEKKLQDILRLLKTSYSREKHYVNLLNPAHSGARLYFIKNPEVLDEYRNYLRRKKILPLSSEEVDYDSGDRRKSLESKRRAELQTASTELSEANDFDRADSQDDKEPINEKLLETTQTLLSDYVQDKQSQITDDLIQKPPKRIDLKEVVKDILSKSHDEIKVDSFEAQNDKSGDLVRREKIEWADSNDKFDKYVSKENIKIEKPFKSTKKKHKNSNDRREKRVYDDPVTEREVHYKPKPKVNYRKPKSDGKKDYFSYGRTSIPFIGKKGIYEDK
ncbi:uncharacterized protein LOC126780050 isoform X2 [Nymphalis io]|uniref:uncharacterized protein LOC126780050 isoform X2 n=1 Tax=Inachis io TaxID=171585 RepID=UPI00216A94FE|nr:uncharacterized protein LOC126780050 isoform X2 [Nymphalis io]